MSSRISAWNATTHDGLGKNGFMCGQNTAKICELSAIGMLPHVAGDQGRPASPKGNPLRDESTQRAGSDRAGSRWSYPLVMQCDAALQAIVMLLVKGIKTLDSL